MRFGCCGSMVAPDRDPVGIDIVETMAALGYDYIELSLADIVRLSPAAQAALRRRLDDAGLACEACNNLFPAALRLTGPAVDVAAITAYADIACETAARVGAGVIVFGSGPAKRVPAAFPHDAAWTQLVDLSARLGDIAVRHGLTVVLEPLNRLECNIVTTAAEALRLMRQVDHPGVRLLIDAYHLLREAEAPDVVTVAGPAIRHVHVAAGLDRRFPTTADADLAALFARLTAAGYAGRVSVEAYTDDVAGDGRRSLTLLRALAAATPSPRPATA